MTASTTASDPASPEIEPRWGLNEAVVGWFLAYTLGSIATVVLAGVTRFDAVHQAALDVVGKVTGHTYSAGSALPLWAIAISELFLWTGFLGVPLAATHFKGNGIVRDLGLRVRWIDVPIGVAAGIFSQYVLAYVLSVPWVWVLGKHMSDLSAPAKQLSDKATDPVGIALFILIVAVGAPIAEEIFFRGLLQRSLLRRFGPIAAVALSALIFGLTHFELLQLPALIGFGVVLGVLAVRTGRLGPGIFAHLSFNAVTVVALLAHK